jgi:hypothetical protein
MEVVENEKPELILMPGEIISDHIFIFLLDRSGSMGIEKMKMAKDVLIYFIKRLPMGSMFEVISFGKDFSVSSRKRCGFENNDENVK